MAPQGYSTDENLQQLLDGLKRIQQTSEPVLANRLLKAYEKIRLPATLVQAQESLPWVLKRIELFQILPKHEQRQYINDLMHKCRNMKRPTYEGHNVVATQTINLLRLLPCLPNFVSSIRRGLYGQERDGNWFIWWDGEHKDFRQQEGILPGSEEEVQADRSLLDHLLQTETAQQSNMQGLRSEPNTSASEPARSSPRGTIGIS
ncbi:hypothetical protein F4819DRAFT_466610 [Hypoxylon fuscum]|nr:hypothetical protein F4819DRAFT_466610 [Hypoxylon fuscum]